MSEVDCVGKYNPDDSECMECSDRIRCMSQSVLMVPLDQIDYIPDPVRDGETEKLDESIKERGILQPVVASYDKETRRFRLIFGGRRYQATKNLGHAEIPVIVKEASDLDNLLLRLHENIHRENYSPLGLLKALEELRNKHGMNQKQIAKAIGRSETWVSMVMKASKLPDSIKEKMESGEIKPGVDRVSKLAKIPEKKAEKMVEEGATKEQVRKASLGRKLKYQWKHKGKLLSGLRFTATLVFNDEDVEPGQIIDALEECKKGI